MRLTVVCSLNRGAKMINATVTLSQTELANHIEYTWSVTVGEGYKKVKVKNVKVKNVKVKNTKVKNVKVKNVKVKNVKVKNVKVKNVKVKNVKVKM